MIKLVKGADVDDASQAIVGMLFVLPRDQLLTAIILDNYAEQRATSWRGRQR